MEDFKDLVEKCEAMEPAEVRRALREKYGYDARFLYLATAKQAAEELAKELAEEANPRQRRPRIVVMTEKGCYLDHKGEWECDPYVALAVAYGYDTKALNKMSDDQRLGEWGRLAGFDPKNPGPFQP